jgi:hypothetical protein
VKNLSEDVRKSGEGMLDPEPLTFPRGELPPQLERVAFALKEGEWSEVEDTPARLLLIQLVKRDRQQLGQVSARIEKNLQGKKIQALLDDLKKKAGTWMDEQYFGTAVVPARARSGVFLSHRRSFKNQLKKGGTMKMNGRSRSFCYLAPSVSLLAAVRLSTVAGQRPNDFDGCRLRPDQRSAAHDAGQHARRPNPD